MTEITISPGVKIVTEKDCDRCEEFQARLTRLINETAGYEACLTRIKNMKQKVQYHNTFEAGYNHGIEMVKKIIDYYTSEL